MRHNCLRPYGLAFPPGPVGSLIIKLRLSGGVGFLCETLKSSSFVQKRLFLGVRSKKFVDPDFVIPLFHQIQQIVCKGKFICLRKVYCLLG